MKKVLRLLLPSLCLAALPLVAWAETSVDSTTMLRFYQDTHTGFAAKNFVPVTQFLSIDADKLGDGKLSAHLYGWGRLDLAEHYVTPGQADSSMDGRLTYGYLQYRFGAANAQARAGRFFVHEGIVNEQLDGVSARTDLPYGFGLSAFGGATVHTSFIPSESTDGKGDGIFGGRVNYRYGGLLELGLSGVYESKAPLLTDPALAGKFGDHRLIGGDLWFSPLRMLQVIGHTSYNTETAGVAEHSYLVQLKPLKNLVVAGEFNEYRDRDMFYASALFAGLLNAANLNQQSRSYGGRASYSLNDKAELSADLKHYSRDLGKADRFGGELRYTLPDSALRAGLGYHYLRTDPDFAIIPSSSASGSFHELRAYAMRDTKSYFASLDVIDYLFKKQVDSKFSAWEMSGSLGYHLTPSLACSGDLSYGSNPQYADELKGLLRLTYITKIAGKGDSK
jgi:hypothetical protein